MFTKKITDKKRIQILANIKLVQTLEELAKAKLVIEAIIEDLLIKQDVFSQLESLLEEDAILATNTSSIDLNNIGSVLKRPERLVGMHFFNPAPVMALVEVVQSTETDSEVADLVFSLAEQWGKIPVHVRSSPGFIVNRAARPFYSEALAILKEGGTDAATCDAIMRECGGFRMGPFELMDLIGLDVNYAVTCQIWESYQRHPRFAPSVLQKELVNSGRLGRKSGQGFFEYGVDVEIQAPNNAPESPAPASIIIEGPEKLPQSLLKLIEGGSLKTKSISGNGIIRLPAGAAFMISNGKSSTERSLDFGRKRDFTGFMFGLFSVPAYCACSGVTVFRKRFTGSSGSFSVFGQTGICIERYSRNGSDTYCCHVVQRSFFARPGRSLRCRRS